MKLQRTIALIMALLFFGTVAFAEYAIYTIAEPTWVRSTPQAKDDIHDANLKPDSIFEWGGHTSVDSRGVAWFDIFYGNNYGWVSSLHVDLYDRQTDEFYHYTNYPTPNMTSVFAKRDLDVYSSVDSDAYFIDTMTKGESAIFTGFRKKDSKGNEWLQRR